MTDDEFGFPRRQAEVDLEVAPATRALLERNPAMWPRIHSFAPARWDEEIADALKAIAHLSTETGVEIRVAQFKSKLAGLRIYLDIDEESAGHLEVVDSTPISTRLRASSRPGSVRERATAIIDAAAQRCETRCELCGGPGVLRHEGGWLSIACNDHARPDPNAGRAG